MDEEKTLHGDISVETVHEIFQFKSLMKGCLQIHLIKIPLSPTTKNDPSPVVWTIS